MHKMKCNASYTCTRQPWEANMRAPFGCPFRLGWKQILTVVDKALPEPPAPSHPSVTFPTSLPLSSLGPSHTSFLATLELPGKCLLKTLHCCFLGLEHSSQNIHKANHREWKTLPVLEPCRDVSSFQSSSWLMASLNSVLSTLFSDAWNRQEHTSDQKVF